MRIREINQLRIPLDLYQRVETLAQRKHGAKADMRAFLLEIVGEVVTAMEREYAVIDSKSRLVVPVHQPVLTVGPLVVPR